MEAVQDALRLLGDPDEYRVRLVAETPEQYLTFHGWRIGTGDETLGRHDNPYVPHHTVRIYLTSDGLIAATADEQPAVGYSEAEEEAASGKLWDDELAKCGGIFKTIDDADDYLTHWGIPGDAIDDAIRNAGGRFFFALFSLRFLRF